MIKDELKIYDDPASLCEGFTRFLQNKLLTQKDKIRIAISGGTTPKSLFDLWAEKYKNILPWERIYFFWVDERCVPPDNNVNNYGMTKEHLFDKVDVPSNNIHRIHGENEPEEEVLWYSNILDEYLDSKKGVPVFDLVILGLGEDGHTASIFPEQIDSWNSPENCIVTSHPRSGMKRVTITGKIINNAEIVAFMATGENKALKIKEIVNNRVGYIDEYPAARVNPISKRLFWFIDKKAASLL